MTKTLFPFGLICALGLLLSACDQDADQLIDPDIAIKSNPPPAMNKVSSPAVSNTKSDQYDDLKPDNSRYLFDVKRHTVTELEGLLNRVEEIHLKERDRYEDLDLVLILHGPDIHLFTYQNYEKNKSLVDLAARLDAFGMIDLKICETAMSMIGVKRSDVPPFIESVPFAPKEIEKLTDIGYINL